VNCTSEPSPRALRRRRSPPRAGADSTFSATQQSSRSPRRAGASLRLGMHPPRLRLHPPRLRLPSLRPECSCTGLCLPCDCCAREPIVARVRADCRCPSLTSDPSRRRRSEPAAFGTGAAPGQSIDAIAAGTMRALTRKQSLIPRNRRALQIAKGAHLHALREGRCDSATAAALLCRDCGSRRCACSGLIRDDLQAHLALARVGEQPPSSTPTSLPVREPGERTVAHRWRLLRLAKEQRGQSSGPGVLSRSTPP
jgi:hypothetical protein